MKNNKTLILFFLIILTSCVDKMQGERGASKDINEAKKRNTFIQSYCLLKKDIDSINIKLAFFERGFGYGKTIEETEKSFYGYLEGRFQLTIKIEKGMLKRYYNNYYLKVENAEYRNKFCGEDAIYCPMDSILIKDTLKVFVFRKYSKVNEDTIGTLIFVKCNI